MPSPTPIGLIPPIGGQGRPKSSTDRSSSESLSRRRLRIRLTIQMHSDTIIVMTTTRTMSPPIMPIMMMADERDVLVSGKDGYLIWISKDPEKSGMG